MTDYDFDLFTIGAGSGGVAASRRAGSHGARVAICEADRVGGTCVMRGCVPKKLLVIGSHFGEAFADARAFGWTVEGTLDWGALVAAKDREIDRLEGVYHRLLRDSGVTELRGRARLIDAHTVDVDGARHTARNILVATGGNPVVPRVTGAEHGIVSSQALDLPALPESVVVVGGGYIGCELAGVLHAAGSRVTMIIRGDALLRSFDGDVASALTQAYRAKGISVRCESFVRDVTKRDDGRLSVLFGDAETIDADAVIWATGRAPSTRGIGLEEAGVALDAHDAILVDAQSRTTVPSVFAVGDCTNRLNLTPVAIAEGRALAEMLFNRGDGVMDHADVPTAVFSQPPVGTVGLTEARAREKHGTIDVYVSSFRPMMHTLTGREQRTMMKLVVDRASQRVVGLHIVGDDAPEIAQGFAVAIRCGATKADFDRTVGIHPTAAEELVTMRDMRPEPQA